MAKGYFKKEHDSGYTGQTGLAGNGRPRNGMSRLWRAIRRSFPATATELAQEAELSDTVTQIYLGILERGGYLWREPRPSCLYWLIKDTGHKTPQVRKNATELLDGNTGERLPVAADLQRWPGQPAPAGSPDHRTWQAMRMLRNFTVSELATVTELEEGVISAQVKSLHQFNYLRETEASLGEPSYMLPRYRDTGDRPPAINRQLGRLYDYKTKEIISIQG